MDKFTDDDFLESKEDSKNQDIMDENVSQIIGKPQDGGEKAQEKVHEEELPPVPEQKKKIGILPIVVLFVIILGAGAFIFIKKQNNLKAQEMLRLEQEEAERLAEEESIRAEEDAKLLAELEENKQQETEKKEYESYTPEQVNDLLSLGLTPEQIHSFDSDGVEYEVIKEQLETRIKKRYYDLQKEAYENTENLYRWTQFGTWLTYPDSVSPESPKQYTQSCKYEKVPPYGFQTQLCIYLDVSNEYERFYLTVDPALYESLKESDFINVTYKYRYDKGMGQYWIYDMKIEDTNVEDKFVTFIDEHGINIE